MDETKPCIFCGAKTVVAHATVLDMWSVTCTSDLCMESPLHESKQQAIDEYNGIAEALERGKVESNLVETEKQNA